MWGLVGLPAALTTGGDGTPALAPGPTWVPHLWVPAACLLFSPSDLTYMWVAEGTHAEGPAVTSTNMIQRATHGHEKLTCLSPYMEPLEPVMAPMAI